MRISRNSDTKLIKILFGKMNKIYVNKFAFLLIVYRVKAMKLRQSDTDKFTNGFVDEMKEMMFVVVAVSYGFIWIHCSSTNQFESS